MSRDVPGKRLYDVLARILDQQLVQSVIAPTFADFHYELQRAGADRWRRRLAYVRCFAALIRVLVLGNVVRGASMRRVLVVVILGAVGAASLMWAQSVTVMGPLGLAPLFAMALIAPMVFRLFALGPDFRQMFVNCASVGTLMWAPAVISLPQFRRVPLLWQVASLTAMAGCVMFASALVAAAAWKPTARSNPPYRRVLLALLSGAAVFTLGIATSRMLIRTPRNLPGLTSSFATAVFAGFLFALAAAVVHLPIVLLAQRASRRPLWLALIGALLSPLPMFTILFFGGHWQAVSRFFTVLSPAVAMIALTPYALAGAAIGWFLAARAESPGLQPAIRLSDRCVHDLPADDRPPFPP